LGWPFFICARLSQKPWLNLAHKMGASHLDLLLELAKSINMAFSSDGRVVALAHDITDSVDKAVAR